MHPFFCQSRKPIINVFLFFGFYYINLNKDLYRGLKIPMTIYFNVHGDTQKSLRGLSSGVFSVFSRGKISPHGIQC
jgi:hypothetical protein